MATMTPKPQEALTSVPAAADEPDDVDEPPEQRLHQPSPHPFQRTVIRRPGQQPSLLTKAIMGHSDDDSRECSGHVLSRGPRRRSMTSNISIASTADLTSDTGLTSPCRTNTPSPPIPEVEALRLTTEAMENKSTSSAGLDSQAAVTQELPKKRCIQFACASKPVGDGQPPALVISKAPSAQEAPRRPCIKFAYPLRSVSDQEILSKQRQESATRPTPIERSGSALMPTWKSLDPSIRRPSPPAVPMGRRTSNKAMLGRPKFLRANSVELVKDGSQFHEFASGTERLEDWIRQDDPAPVTKLTINDTLTFENRIRRLAAEAEEEEEEEEEAGAAAADEAVASDDEDGSDGDSQDGDDSDGYSSDEETGFADSDDGDDVDDDDDDNDDGDDDDDDENGLHWTPIPASAVRMPALAPPGCSSLGEAVPRSEAEAISNKREKGKTTEAAGFRAHSSKSESGTPDLPDSTDFVCGTLDEDKPLEEAYLSCLAARRNVKLRVIPQDIDPSFPASDPDSDEDQKGYRSATGHDSGTNVWLHGEMEDVHQTREGSRRRRKKEQQESPRRFHSPPPRRHHSPAPPKTRGRSPKAQPRRLSPRRARSPAPKGLGGALPLPMPPPPPYSPKGQTTRVPFPLGDGPKTKRTKSLPRPAAGLSQARPGRNRSQLKAEMHVRGAIDIVKGLERKRQRRQEKFFQKYCNRARRGQIPERKPQPGQGAERMKELGLTMAGKKDQGNYVLSI